MPYSIEEDHADCEGYAVVKEGGELIGCHRTEQQALDHLAALVIATEDEYEDRIESHTPTDAMVEEADRGLAWREEYGRGGTEIGVARARDISNRRALSIDTIGRMVSYFARHEVDKDGQGWSPDQDGYPSAGRIAWALWGGDPGRAWAERIFRQERAGQGPAAIISDIDGTLVDPSGANRELIYRLNEYDGAVIVITGRLSDRRDDTVELLRRLELNFDELIMSDGGDPNAHKKAAAEDLLERYTIDIAYDDNPDARAAYSELGIDARPPKSNRARAEQMLATLRSRH